MSCIEFCVVWVWGIHGELLGIVKGLWNNDWGLGHLVPSSNVVSWINNSSLLLLGICTCHKYAVGSSSLCYLATCVFCYIHSLPLYLCFLTQFTYLGMHCRLRFSPPVHAFTALCLYTGLCGACRHSQLLFAKVTCSLLIWLNHCVCATIYSVACKPTQLSVKTLHTAGLGIVIITWSLLSHGYYCLGGTVYMESTFPCRSAHAAWTLTHSECIY